jgi:hypothetical protein
MDDIGPPPSPPPPEVPEGYFILRYRFCKYFIANKNLDGKHNGMIHTKHGLSLEKLSHHVY